MVLPTLAGVDLKFSPGGGPLAAVRRAHQCEPCSASRRAPAKPASARARSETAWPASVPR
jgi:hypothetical protein